VEGRSGERRQEGQGRHLLRRIAVPAQEPDDVKKGEADVLDLASKKRKKTRVAVSIRKGTLLFFPTAVPISGEKPAEPSPKTPEGNKSERT
jgi:hypothetical protein